jgi:hypothetical protein
MRFASSNYGGVMKRLLEVAITVVSVVLLTALIVVGVLDWTGGCGETFVHADGTRHAGDCIGREILKGGFK